MQFFGGTRRLLAVVVCATTSGVQLENIELCTLCRVLVLYHASWSSASLNFFAIANVLFRIAAARLLFCSQRRLDLMAVSVRMQYERLWVYVIVFSLLYFITIPFANSIFFCGLVLSFVHVQCCKYPGSFGSGGSTAGSNFIVRTTL